MKTTEEFKGTKGIWDVLFVEFNNYDILCIAKEDIVISQQTFGGKATEEMKANAQLIAAAPELLEALQELVLQVKTYSKGYSDTTEYFKSEIKQAEKAINKALGL